MHFRLGSRDDRRVEIKASGLLSDGKISLGRLIPWLVLDSDSQPSIGVAIRAHKGAGLGEAVSQWGFPLFPKDKDNVFLRVIFREPVAGEFYIIFPLIDQAKMIYAIMQAQAVILVDGKGQTEKALPVGLPQMSVEIPDMGDEERFLKFYQRFWEKRFRKKGRSRQKIREKARRKVADLKRDYGEIG